MQHPTRPSHAMLVLAACLAVSLPASAQHAAPAATSTAPAAITSTQDEQQALALTIYNDSLALVKDKRQISLPGGNLVLSMRDVSARIRPETAQLRSLTAIGALRVQEQNFDYDLLSPQKLLDKSVGQTVRVVRSSAAGTSSTETATVLSTNNGLVLQYADRRIETGLPADARLVFDQVPPQLRDRPTLSITLNNDSAQSQSVELSYLTGGLSWHADYVAELGSDEAHLDLSAWVTLTNQSGTAYRNAKVQLVAGDVHQARPPEAPMQRMVMATAAPKMADVPAEEALFEYHLYSLPNPTTLANNQTKQVALLSANQVAARKVLLLEGDDSYYLGNYIDSGMATAIKRKPMAILEFDNRRSNQLGIPLPKGVVRVYKRDSSGNAQFIGEDNIAHTASNDTVRLHLGESFDVTTEKKQTDFKRTLLGNTANRQRNLYESAIEISLKNAKKEPVIVTVREPMPGEWQISSTSHPYQKTNAHQAEWQVSIPAEGETVLRYRVVTKL